MSTTTTSHGLFSAGLRALTTAAITMVAVQAFETVAVSTAMPTVASALHGLDLYALAFGIPAAAGIVGMVGAGIWSDRRGPVGPLATGWLLFVAGLLFSGTAGSMPVLVCGRALQGLGTGLTIVALYVIVARVYPEAFRPRIFSAFSAAWILPALVGPAIAGFLVVHVGWRWVFLCVPFIALAAAAIGWAPCRRLRILENKVTDHETPGDDGEPHSNAPRRSHDPAPGPHSGPRMVMFAAMAGAAACLLSLAGQYGAALELPLTALSVGLLVISVPRLLPPRTYRSGRGLPTVVLLRGLVSAAFTGAEVFLPLLLSRERGLSPTQAGFVLTVGALGWSAGSQLQGVLSSPARRPTLLRLGFAMLTLGIVLASATVWHQVPLLTVYPSWAIAGLGIGIAYPTLSVLTLDLSAPAEQGRNTSALQVNDALLQSITLAASGTVFAALVGHSHTAPYLAGFAIAAGAAGLGVLLAHRVRVVAVPGGAQSSSGLARQGSV